MDWFLYQSVLKPETRAREHCYFSVIRFSDSFYIFDLFLIDEIFFYKFMEHLFLLFLYLISSFSAPVQYHLLKIPVFYVRVISLY